MAKQGKKLRDAYKNIKADCEYSLSETVELLKNSAPAKFDETVEVHLNTTLDSRHADQQLRTSVTLPNGIGKEMKVAVVVEGEAAAKKAAAAAATATATAAVAAATWGRIEVPFAAVVFAEKQGKWCCAKTTLSSLATGHLQGTVKSTRRWIPL